MADRRILTQISPIAWEHPADRAALNTLRAIPGFDEVVRKIAGFFGERGIRHLFAGNAVRVTPRQRPKLHALYREVLETMDWPVEPELYVTQTPTVNAGAVGFDNPFIIINSGTLGLLEREEQRTVLGHELGHIMSGHATYRTIALLILQLGLSNLPFLTGIALLPIQLALFEWFRKSELSSDRAGLLSGQDPTVAMMTELKLAGGSPRARVTADGEVEALPVPEWDEISLDEFLVQAEEYETGGTAVDTIFKYMNVAFQTHPFHTVRVAELHRWVRSGDYYRILGGDYPHRGEERARPLGGDYAEAGGYYRDRAKEVVDQVGQLVRNARDAFNQASQKHS
ncbi:MAG TPA: M48 family metallopeptidase [Gemmatimonadaceae bacterium]|nr:M48 family metallopeptidase [Gemmatimonadaceae bacterium]